MKILYIAHSSPRIHRRTAYSILSCLQVHGGRPPCPIELVTDNPDFYRDFDGIVGMRTISETQINSWIKRAHGYRYIAKPEIFLEQDDSFMFFDGDTVLLKPLPPLFKSLSPKTSLMQRREYRLGHRPEFASLLLDSSAPEYTSRTWMYNSGLLGIHRDNLAILKTVKTKLLELLGHHEIRTMEQLVLGECLAQRTKILTAPRWIYHYWQDKGFADAFMDRFFDGMGLPEMLRRVLGGNGSPLFDLGFRRNPFFYDIYMRLLPRFERFSARYNHLSLSVKRSESAPP